MIYYTIIFVYMTPERLVFWLVYYVQILELKTRKHDDMCHNRKALSREAWEGNLKVEPDDGGFVIMFW